jgi:calcineurin-like phosphoesterase family protein
MHFDHENIILYTHRPFRTVELMNEELIRRWNSTVPTDATIIHCGDFYFPSHYDKATKKYLRNRIDEIANMLSGQKIWIKGNHSDPKPNIYGTKRSFGGYSFTYIHNPYDTNFVRTSKSWLIHGHTHNNQLENFPFINIKKHTINVSCELLDFTPISMRRILEYIKHAQANHINITYAKDVSLEDSL